jgi:hypothetical protein
MAYLQRVPFRQVSIAPDTDTLGRVLMGAWPDWANPDSCEYRERAAYDYFLRHARVSLAGQIAEAHHLGKPPRSGMHGDNRCLAALALPLCRGIEDTANAMLEWLYLDTRDRLTSPLVWPAVESLADALVERKTLGARAARSLIRAAYRTGDFSLVAPAMAQSPDVCAGTGTGGTGRPDVPGRNVGQAKSQSSSWVQEASRRKTALGRPRAGRARTLDPKCPPRQ